MTKEELIFYLKTKGFRRKNKTALKNGEKVIIDYLTKNGYCVEIKTDNIYKVFTHWSPTRNGGRLLKTTTCESEVIASVQKAIYAGLKSKD